MNTMTINGIRYRELLMAGAAMLEVQREVVNNLNVFPVPDGDTGTNMSMTMTSVLSGSHGGVAAVSDYTAACARDMMRAARGNSGVILSLFFRGMARAFVGCETISPPQLLEAVKEGARSAAVAVERPVEGTILTVMRECAAGIDAPEAMSFEQLFEQLYKNAEAILAKTPEMLPALRRARVVDSGGYGFVRIIEGMKKELNGEHIADKVTVSAVRPAADFDVFSAEEITFAFCTECLIDLDGELDESRIAELRKTLSKMGDSMVLTADEEILKLHIHTDEPLTVLGMVFELGTLRHSKVENMKLQHTELISAPVSTEESESEEQCEIAKYGVFAVSPGDGFSDLFKELGANGIIAGGQSMNPSADDILEAIKKYPCETAIILPNNGNIIMAANQAAELVEKGEVIVIPTKTLPQGISALFAFNESRTPEQNREEMQDAASLVTTLSFTRAVRDAEVDGKSVRMNQFLGLREGKVKIASDVLEDAIAAMLDGVADSEIVTLYYGKDVKEDAAEKMCELVTGLLGDSAEVSLVCGGQPLYPYIISAE